MEKGQTEWALTTIVRNRISFIWTIKVNQKSSFIKLQWKNKKSNSMKNYYLAREAFFS